MRYYLQNFVRFNYGDSLMCCHVCGVSLFAKNLFPERFLNKFVFWFCSTHADSLSEPMLGGDYWNNKLIFRKSFSELEKKKLRRFYFFTSYSRFVWEINEKTRK